MREPCEYDSNDKRLCGKSQCKTTIYESYQPRSIDEAKEYTNFILNERSILPHQIEEEDTDTNEMLNPQPKHDYDFMSNPLLSHSRSKYFSNFLDKEREKRIGQRHYLIFDSLFECANLAKVIAVSENEYELYLNSDTNSPNRSQWFYFMVTNTKKNSTVKFSIMNITKNPHFYKQGMKPMIFSEKDNNAIYTSWVCRVENVNLTKSSGYFGRPQGNRYISLNSQAKENDQQYNFSYHVLSFTHTFKYDDDRVYFAFNKPYSYTYLNRALSKFVTKIPNDIFYKKEILCHSLAGVPVHMLIISDNNMEKRRYVVITARVHSSETPGSYKVQGIINFLLSRNSIAEALRHQFIFLIIPMLNPDGVIFGNNRCSLGGFDLNRCWGHPTIQKQPTVYALKKKLHDLTNSGKQIYVFCDLHGHSKLLNSFMYACHTISDGSFCSWTKIRILPRILARKSHILNYHQCSFKVEPDKLTTARVIVWREFKVPNSFTLESSIFAYEVGEEVVMFTRREYNRIGEALMEALNDYRLLMEQAEGESNETREWIKPGRLNEITGIPAADVLKQEILEDKEEEKRRKNLEVKKIRMQMNKIQSNTSHDAKFNRKPPLMKNSRVINEKSFDTSSSIIVPDKNEGEEQKNRCATPNIMHLDIRGNQWNTSSSRKSECCLPDNKSDVLLKVEQKLDDLRKKTRMKKIPVHKIVEVKQETTNEKCSCFEYFQPIEVSVVEKDRKSSKANAMKVFELRAKGCNSKLLQKKQQNIRNIVNQSESVAPVEKKMSLKKENHRPSKKEEIENHQKELEEKCTKFYGTMHSLVDINAPHNINRLYASKVGSNQNKNIMALQTDETNIFRKHTQSLASRRQSRKDVQVPLTRSKNEFCSGFPVDSVVPNELSKRGSNAYISTKNKPLT